MDSEEKETKRRLVLKNKKALLEIIKKKPRKWNEIVKEVEKYKISKDSVNKYLDEFKEIGIIKKDKDECWWYTEHEVAVEDKNYNIAMNHSLLVLPGFVEISREYGGSLAIEKIEYVKLSNVQQPASSYSYSDTPYNKEMVVEYAKEHLKTGYPEVWEAVNKALVIFKPLEKSLKELKGEETKKTIIFKLESLKELEGKETEEKNEDFIKSQLREGPTFKIEPMNYDDLEKFLKEEQERLNKIKQNADIELFKIVHKVLSGEPLKGECKGCPKVCLYYQPEEEQGEENKEQVRTKEEENRRMGIKV